MGSPALRIPCCLAHALQRMAGPSGLCKAAMHGRMEVVWKLIAAGADIQQRGPRGSSPLHCAALRGHEEVVRLLCEADADMSARDNNECTALHYGATRETKMAVV